MVFVTESAEKVLSGMLEDFMQTSPHLRCAWFHFSEAGGMPPGYFTALDDSLEELSVSNMAQVFRCDDEDIFVVAPHLSQRFIAMLFTHPALAQLPTMPAPSQGLASLYEIGFDGDRLRDVVERKLMIAEQQKQEKKMAEEQARKSKIEEQERLKTVALTTSVPLNQIETIAARRSGRKEAHILVVEDDLFTQKLVSKTIGSEFSVLYVSDAQQAIRKYASFCPDIVFLDIGLPDAPGHDVLRKLLEMDTQAYVVMFSGNGDRDNVVRAIEYGAKGFIGKPFTKAKIAEYIQKCPHTRKKNLKEIG